jgi:hypothetical protein
MMAERGVQVDHSTIARWVLRIGPLLNELIHCWSCWEERSDYVPTGYKGYGIARRAVPGHPFGLTLNADDKASLTAFLKTL